MTDLRNSGQDGDDDGSRASLLNVEAEAASTIGLGGPDDDDNDMPEHEEDPDDTVGGGVMSEGGTAIDRGTGTLAGEAQGGDAQGD